MGRFTTHETILKKLSPNLEGQVAIVTGAAGGIGIETVYALAKVKARVVLAVRNVEEGQKVAEGLQKRLGGKADLTVLKVDLADLSTVKTFCATFEAQFDRLDFLVLNAGVMFTPKWETKQGFEMQFGTNHLGHYYMTELLLPRMIAQDRPSRIICVSSIGHHIYPGFDLTDLNWKTRKYNPKLSYGQSKLCNVLQALELADRLNAKGSKVRAFSLHPGEVAGTKLSQHDKMIKFVVDVLFYPFMMNVKHGAATTILACADPSLESESQNGCYLKYAKVSKASKEGRDLGLAKGLKEASDKMLLEAGFPVPA